MIYVLLRGRIGNQLFMYSLARQIQFENDEKQTIVIDDTSILRANWVNSLPEYPLKNTIYQHDKKVFKSFSMILPRIGYFLYRVMTFKKSYMKKYKIEKRFQPFFNFLGLVVCENGYLPYKTYRKNIMIHGYFQSTKYFEDVASEIKECFAIDDVLEKSDYPGLNQLQTRNSICISIKVEHNVGNEEFDVCTKEYWEKAIRYVTESVENPLFFICSDNLEYVKNNLIDCTKYDVLCQDTTYPVHISLAVMSKCKHFIIGNTSYGWWAQYLSMNESKIVVAPKKWMNVEIPIDIYQDEWYRIE